MYLNKNKLQVGRKDIIEINKDFGPTIACDIRINCDTNSGNWIIEKCCTEVDVCGNSKDIWEEVCRIDFQDCIDFDSQDEMCNLENT